MKEKKSFMMKSKMLLSSFFTGLAIFSIIKLICMIPLNYYAIDYISKQPEALKDAATRDIQGLGSAISLILIYVSYKITKKIRLIENINKRRLLRISIFIAGIICLTLSSFILISHG
ncbi:hypothetical protein [Motilimonas pumila]|uniref:Uncharacterized protein n=1 Tax=Motilimonas pumila TaxID=2303987 RepID=A0A418Y9L5_9GAMM|nr:hypothetical protein [Motilimonas pumila]RJG37760.1 hypothetical protein D1Z90_19600 [Motilimonas pumila]